MRKSPADQVAVCMGIVCMEIDSMETGHRSVFREAKVDLLYFELLDYIDLCIELSFGAPHPGAVGFKLSL